MCVVTRNSETVQKKKKKRGKGYVGVKKKLTLGFGNSFLSSSRRKHMYLSAPIHPTPST